MALRTLNYHRPANPLSPLNRGLVGWWRVLPGRMGGARLWDLTNQHPAVLMNLSPSTATVGWGSTSRPGGQGEIRFQGGADTGALLAAGNVPLFAVLALGPMSYAAWVFPRVIVDGTKLLSREGDASDSYMALITVTTGGLLFYRRYTGFPEELLRQSVDGALTAGRWQYVALTWDGGAGQTGVRLYVNGQELGYGGGQDAGGSPSNIDQNMILAFGGCTVAGSIAWDGAMDDMRMYNRVLTATEVSLLYQTSRLGSLQELAWMTLPVEIPTWAPPPARPRLRMWKRRV